VNLYMHARSEQLGAVISPLHKPKVYELISEGVFLFSSMGFKFGQKVRKKAQMMTCHSFTVLVQLMFKIKIFNTVKIN